MSSPVAPVTAPLDLWALSGLISSYLSLGISLLSLVLGWQSDRTMREAVTRISAARKLEAARVDKLLDTLGKVALAQARQGGG